MSKAHPDLICKRVAEIVTDYLDGELSAPDRAQLEQHLLICSACADFVAQNKQTIAGLRTLAPAPLPAAARANALAAFRKRQGGDE